MGRRSIPRRHGRALDYTEATPARSFRDVQPVLNGVTVLGVVVLCRPGPRGGSGSRGSTGTGLVPLVLLLLLLPTQHRTRLATGALAMFLAGPDVKLARHPLVGLLRRTLKHKLFHHAHGRLEGVVRLHDADGGLEGAQLELCESRVVDDGLLRGGWR